MKNSASITNNISKVEDLIKKPNAILAEYIIQLETDWYDFDNEIKKMQKKIQNLEKELKKLSPKPSNAVYEKKNSLFGKLLFILKYSETALSVKELSDNLLKHEPDLKFEIRNIKTRISQTLLKEASDQRIIRIKGKGNNYLYMFNFEYNL